MKQKVQILQPRGPLFFGAVKHWEEIYADAGDHDTLIIKLGDVSMVDLSGAYALEGLIDNAVGKGRSVLLCNASPQVIRVLESVKVLDRMAQRNYFDIFSDTLDEAKEIVLKEASQ